MNTKRLFIISMLILTGFAVALSGAVTAISAIGTPPEAPPKGQVRFRVRDAVTGKPLTHAVVCVLEQGDTFYTDNNGNSPIIDVPVVPDNRYDQFVKKEFGEVTVLVRYEGYIDYILLNYIVRENHSRGITDIHIFPRTAEDDLDYMTIVETPDDAWIRQILDKYNKKVDV